MIELRRKRDLGKILDDSFALYRANFGILLLLSALVVVPVDLLVFGVGFGDLWSDYDVRTGNDVRLSDAWETFASLGVQLLVVTPLVTAMTVHFLQRSGEGARPSAAQTIGAGLRVFPRLAPAILLMALGVLGGLLLLVIPGVILAVRWVVVSQVVVVEGRTGDTALGRSSELTRGHGWFAFAVLVVMNLLVGVFAVVVSLPLGAAAERADSMAFSVLAQILSSTLSLPLVAIAYTLLYYSLVTEKEGAAPALPDERGPVSPQVLPGVPGTFGDGWAPPRPPGA